MTDPGPQKQPASVNQIEAQVKQAKREIAATITRKPCPWCRTAEKLYSGSTYKATWWVRCNKCGCAGPSDNNSIEAAWQAWDAMGEQQTDEKGRPMTYWGGKK